MTATFMNQPPARAGRARSWPTLSLAGLAAWLRRRRTLAQLDALDDRMLADIGLRRESLGDDLFVTEEKDLPRP